MAETVQLFCFTCRKRFRRKASADRLRPKSWRDFCSNACKGAAKRRKKTMNEEEAPAVPALKKYLEEQGLTAHAWSLKHSLDPSTTHRILRGQSRPSLNLSLKIERATDGAVPVALWESES